MLVTQENMERMKAQSEAQREAVLAATTGSVKCSLCQWTNVGLLNLGEPGSPKMVCHGCCKRMLDALEKLRDGDFAGTPINRGSSAMMLIEETLSPNDKLSRCRPTATVAGTENMSEPTTQQIGNVGRQLCSSALLACPWCGEPDYDLVGLKSHVMKGECEQFEAISVIRSPFDALTVRQANADISDPAGNGRGA